MKETIILAGGLGTRLRSAVPALPKCMAPVYGKPFIDYIIEYFIAQNIQRFIFSVGYLHELITTHIKSKFPAIDAVFAVEDKPLGTGGAIHLASTKILGENALILNGDTLFKVNVDGLFSLHQEKHADCTLALKPMKNFERYGVVDLNDDKKVIQFSEKKKYKSGLINGGVYVLNIASFLKIDWPEIFSFEKDYLEKSPKEKVLYGAVQDEYFIDIGIPEDYMKAQIELI